MTTPPRSTANRHATAVGAPLGAPAVAGRAGSFVHGPAGDPSARGISRDVDTGTESEDRVSGGLRGRVVLGGAR